MVITHTNTGKPTRTRKATNMKQDVRQLMALLTTKGIRNGDLVLTAEIHRVRDVNWGKREGRRQDRNRIAVSDISLNGKESKGTRIMEVRDWGQQGVMKLKKEVR